MLAPAMMGAAMYAVTRSPLSLLMVVFSPLMMIGSWLDGRLGRRRRLVRELRRFDETLDAERHDLLALGDREIRVRAAETPTLSEIVDAVVERNGLLWIRRPEHRTFLVVRFGAGVLPSRTEVRLPSRGEAAREQWEALLAVERDFREVGPVPVLERFDRCGSIGVTGERLWADGMARSLVLQLVGLHSPAELVLACFGGGDRTGAGHAGQPGEWNWLKWLPHVDPVTTPIAAQQLSDDTAGAARLTAALEGLLEERRSAQRGRATVRSHLGPETRNDDTQSGAVTELPVTPAVVVLVLRDDLVDRSRLIALAESGPDVGIHFIWVSSDTDTLPAACRTFVELGEAQGRVGFVRTGTTVPLQRLEYIEAPVVLELARGLAPVEDASARVLDESDLPRSVNLRELHTTDLLGGSHPILRAWESSGSLTSNWRKGMERMPLALAAVIGQGPDGPVSLDLRVHGPHALVGGTTGAGKSEFLQSWIMSLAAGISPERLSFLLIDYKGGAAFAECVDLPHAVGLVTDLSPRLVRRALTSLRAELRYREELLARHGAKDLITMERRSDPAAPPALVIVIDEFAALSSEVPEFVDGVVDIAQRGRSLGLHLIMATQRPAGVIRDNLRANTNLRVALRMADEADSVDVIGVKDAAFFDAETPGRGAVKIGPGKIGHFQAGYLGGRASALGSDPRIEVRPLDFAEGEPWHIPPDSPPRYRRPMTPSRDIEQLRDGIVGAARSARLRAPRRPWLDPLPELLDLATLAALSDSGADRGAPHSKPGRVGGGDAAAVGLRDEPAAQRRSAVSVDLEQAGNVSFVGAGGTGKTTALITLAASLSLDAVERPVHVYAVDAAGGAIDVISALPTVGTVAPLSDMELVRRILRRMLELIAERGPRYASTRAGGLAAYRRRPGAEAEPRVVLLIDGFGAFRQATETIGGPAPPLQMLSEIMMTGRSVGVHVVLTSDRASAVPATMVSSLQQRFVLRLASPHDYAYLGVGGDALEEGPPGRMLLAGEPEEIQLALLGGRGELAEQAKELEHLAEALRRRGVRSAPEVRNAPEILRAVDLPSAVRDRPAYGIDTSSLEPVGMPTSGLAVVSGPAGSGVSTAALACVEAMTRWASGRGAAVEKRLLTFGADGLRASEEWDRVAFGEDEVRDAARALVVALGPGTSGADEDPRHPAFPGSGGHGVIVVERPADAEGTDALPALVALAKAARRASVLVLFEFEQGNGGAVWDLIAALRQPRWGLTLQPDAGDGQSPFRESLGGVARADFPPGRGFAIESGRVTPVHVALPEGSCRMGSREPDPDADSVPVGYPG